MFNKKEVMKRIQKERNTLDDSLESFAEKISITRQTLSRWENGNGAGPSIEDLYHICMAIDCDIGYLFGEYPYKKRITSDLGIETGLSEGAISQLRDLQNHPCAFAFIDGLLQTPIEYLEKLSKKQIAYTHVKEVVTPVAISHKDDLANKSIILDAEINGEKLPRVPIQDAETFALFDLWLTFSEFANNFSMK